MVSRNLLGLVAVMGVTLSPCASSAFADLSNLESTEHRAQTRVLPTLQPELISPNVSTVDPTYTCSADEIDLINQPISIPVNQVSYGTIRAHDLNDDGVSDLVMTSGSSSLITILTNVHGGFDAPREVVFGTSLYGHEKLAVGDFDNDRLADVAVTDGYRLTILRNSGKGQFSVSQVLIGVSGPSITAGDLNEDGKVDLVFALGSMQGIRPLLNVSSGPGVIAFQAAALIPAIPITPGVEWGEPTSVVLRDINSDGKLDLIYPFLKQHRWFSPESRLGIRFGEGNGNYSAPWESPRLYVYPYPMISDVNHDGRPDVVINMGTSLRAFVNTGASFTEQTFPIPVVPGVSSSPAAFADLNLDGWDDLIVKYYVPNIGIGVLENVGQMSFVPAVNRPLASDSGSVAVADFNRDGLPDFAIARQWGTGTVDVFLNASQVRCQLATPSWVGDL